MPVLMAFLAATLLTSCGGGDPMREDSLGANHYYISTLPSSFREAFSDGWLCGDCSYFEEVTERDDSRGRYTVEFGCRCDAHDIHLETRFSSQKDEMADLVLTISASKYDAELFEEVYSAYSAIVTESSKSIAEIIDEKNSDVCYGEETEAYHVWYGTFATHSARFSTFADGSCRLLADGNVKPTLLGAMM